MSLVAATDFPRGLYGMIDPAVVVPGAPATVLRAEALRQATLLLEEGILALQLRLKGVSTTERLATLTDLVEVSDRRGLSGGGVRWIVNDDVDVVRVALGGPGAGRALSTDLLVPDATRSRNQDSPPAVPGVLAHLGQEDGPDPDVPFGRSTHTLDQVRAAGRAAYVGFGPVFGTTTKHTGYAPRGVAALQAAVEVSRVPVVAIGGITLDTLASVRDTGVHAWAVIGGIWRAPDPRAAVRAFARR